MPGEQVNNRQNQQVTYVGQPTNQLQQWQMCQSVDQAGKIEGEWGISVRNLKKIIGRIGREQIMVSLKVQNHIIEHATVDQRKIIP